MVTASKTNEPKEVKAYQIAIGPTVKVVTDKKSKSRVVHCPFEFPDGENGVLVLIRLVDEEWVPAQDIRAITIEFK